MNENEEKKETSTANDKKKNEAIKPMARSFWKKYDLEEASYNNGGHCEYCNTTVYWSRKWSGAKHNYSAKHHRNVLRVEAERDEAWKALTKAEKDYYYKLDEQKEAERNLEVKQRETEKQKKEVERRKAAKERKDARAKKIATWPEELRKSVIREAFEAPRLGRPGFDIDDIVYEQEVTDEIVEEIPCAAGSHYFQFHFEGSENRKVLFASDSQGVSAIARTNEEISAAENYRQSYHMTYQQGKTALRQGDLHLRLVSYSASKTREIQLSDIRRKEIRGFASHLAAHVVYDWYGDIVWGEITHPQHETLILPELGPFQHWVVCGRGTD